MGLCMLTWFGISAAGASQAEGSKEVQTMMRWGHPVREWTHSYDEKYIFSNSDVEVCVWDARNFMLLKTLPIATDAVYAHPADSRLMYVRKEVNELERFPCAKWKIVNWISGETLGYVRTCPQVKVPIDQFVFSDGQGMISFHTKTTPVVLTGYIGGYNITAGSVHTNYNDSLLVTSGMNPQVWDLRHGRLLHNIRYYRYLNHLSLSTPLTASDLRESPFHENEKPEMTQFVNSYFLPGSDDVIIGGARDTVTVWRIDNEMDKMVLQKEMKAGERPTVSMAFRGDSIIAAGTRDLFLSVGGEPFEEVKRGWNFNCDFQEIYCMSRPYGGNKILVGGINYDGPNLVEYSLDDFSLSRSTYFDYGDICSVAIAPNDRFACVVSDSKAVHLIDLMEYRGMHLEYDHVLEPQINEDTYLMMCEILPDYTVVAGTTHGELIFWDLRHGNHPSKRVRAHQSSVVSLSVSSDSTRFYSSDSDGQLTIWDVATKEPVVKLYQVIGMDEAYMMLTPDNYYKATPNASNFVNFVEDGVAYDFRQFDYRMNRPDIVLERLGGSPEDIALMRKAWQKRLRKAGLKEESLSSDYHVPETEVSNRKKLQQVVNSSTVEIELQFSDSKVDLKNYTVTINGVPVEEGVLEGRRVEKTLTLPLARGLNAIEVSCLNEEGARSRFEDLKFINVSKESLQKVAYIVAAGVSDYADVSYKLDYAHKDAKDFVEAIRAGMGGDYDRVETLVLTDSDFTGQSLGRIREFLSGAGRDDVAILFYAGHGLLDENLDYYLGTPSIDFSNPKIGGVSYDDFIATLKSTPALERYCFVDACHSGKIEKEDFLAVNSVGMDEGEQLVFRAAGKDIKARSEEVERVNSVMENLFHDLTWGEGATVLSSAGGAQLAVEGKAWNNGLFTFCLKKGMEGREADFDSDGKVSFEELIEYTTGKVTELSGGNQVPNLRSKLKRWNQE